MIPVPAVTPQIPGLPVVQTQRGELKPIQTLTRNAQGQILLPPGMSARRVGRWNNSASMSKIAGSQLSEEARRQICILDGQLDVVTESIRRIQQQTGLLLYADPEELRVFQPDHDPIMSLESIQTQLLELQSQVGEMLEGIKVTQVETQV